MRSACVSLIFVLGCGGGGGAAPGDGGGGGPDGAAAAIDASGAGPDAAPCVDEAPAPGAPLAAIGSCGRLVYGPYANRDQDHADNRLPDFSYAGYRRGGVSIPDLPVVETVSPGDGDDRARIQAAIDAASARTPDEDNHADDGPHHRWSTGLLFDNTRSSRLWVQNRQESGTGHGWAGAQVLFWNDDVTDTFISDAPQAAMNWVVGLTGDERDGVWAPEEPPGIRESLGTPVSPRSLYLQQLADRLGGEAVENVTTAAQRDGRIWDALSAWAGEGVP